MEVTWYSIFSFSVLVVSCQISFLATSSPSLTTDKNALLGLKSHITLDPDRILTNNWTNSSHVCTWIGVVCGSRHNRVVALDVSNMSLTGTIPPQLGNLSFLVSLNLGYNNFSGSLPQELSRLRRLKVLDLKFNDFNQEVPSWLGLLSKLEILSLRSNHFTGPIPGELGNLGKLQVLNMQYNYLSGPIPPTIFNLSSLEILAFTSNKLNGSLPIDMCEYLPLLQEIFLSTNQLSGQIPSNISTCSQLVFMSLSNNSFSGQIPKSIGKLNYLQTLYLGGNKLDGVIPQGVGFLQNLVVLAIESNQISGEIPANIFNLSSLQILSMEGNKLMGRFSRDVGNLTMLGLLNIENNKLTGVLPEEIGKLSQLVIIATGHNSFTASSIPPQLFNISTLRTLSFTATGLKGSLPTNIGDGLPVLEELYLSINNLSGAIPDSLSNCSKLREISISQNQFTGPIPHSFGNLRLLERLILSNNNLTRVESSSQELSFITSLTNCRLLRFLSFGSNSQLQGIIPVSVGNFSTSLQELIADNCNIKGSIPDQVGNLTNLIRLVLNINALTGNFPLGVQRLHNLQGIHFSYNNMRGSIPDGLCNLHKLADIHLSYNQFSGRIPECIGNVTSLRYLSLESNMLSSTIPSSLWHLRDLLELDLSTNSLTGSLPLEISNLGTAYYINMSMNKLSEYIPSSIGILENLAYLSLSHNTLQGSIPTSMGSMISLIILDLMHNNLSGSIPMSLQNLQHLSYFDVSSNALTGEIPNGGPFENFTAESFQDNKALCGNVRFDVPPCPIISKHRSKSKKVHVALFISLGVLAFVVAVSLACIFMVRNRIKGTEESRIDAPRPAIPDRISYYEILRATEQFNERNLLGVGSFGSVYKANFGEGKILAVKVFNLQTEAAFRSFDVECEVLRSIRHRNLTKVVGSCSNLDFKALILQYMPNGNLEKRLYSRDDCLDMVQRLNIMIDVASALEYLHHGYSTPIVHCDLKPSNVLLDEDMTAHVSDFGIAKLLGEENSTTITKTLATLGYIAPEYGTEGLVSTRCDVFSYGIMLMETFTSKRPSDEMFEGDVSLRSWVAGLLPESLDQIIDANLLNAEAEARICVDKMLHCVSSILELALKCSAEYPKDRIDMKGAFAELQKIKCRFLA